MTGDGGRKYAQLLKSVWSDPEWRLLSRDAQWLYELLISQASMNYAGVLDLTARRWSRLAAGTTVADIEAALEELAVARFIVVDPDTEEVLVRTFIRNDGLWKQARMFMIALSEARDVQSPILREALAIELLRLPISEIKEGKRDSRESVVRALDATIGVLGGGRANRGPAELPSRHTDQAYAQVSRREPRRDDYFCTPSGNDVDAVTTPLPEWGDNPGGPGSGEEQTEPDVFDPEQVFSQVSRREPRPLARARVGAHARHQSPNTNHLSPGTGAASVGNSTTDRERENRDDQPAGPPVPPNAWAVIREVIPAEQPQTVRTELALQVSTLQKSGTAPDVIKDSLTLWLKKPTLGPRALPVIVSEVLKRRNGATGNTKPGGADRAQSILDRTNRLTATTEASHAQLD